MKSVMRFCGEEGSRAFVNELEMLDWDDLRYFLAIERHGNLSAAARELGVAQSTVGRRLASLEAHLGVRLLNRTPTGYVPTLAGHEVRGKAVLLEEQFRAVEHVVGGRDVHLAGLVRVTCSEAVAAYILALCFTGLHREHPDILVELIPVSEELSLARREVDLSVRLTTPSQHDIIIGRVGSLAYGLYASGDYLDDHGPLDFGENCPGHHLIRQLDDAENPPQFEWLDTVMENAKTVFQTYSHEAAVSAALEGGGLACLARFRADREKNLVRLNPPVPCPTAGIWMAVHKDNRDTVRIRAVMDHVKTRLRTMREALLPEGAPEPHSDGSQ